MGKGIKEPDIDERRMLRELSEALQRDCKTEAGMTNTIINYLWQNSVISIKSNTTWKSRYRNVNRFLAARNYDATLNACENIESNCVRKLSGAYNVSANIIRSDRAKLFGKDYKKAR